MTERWAACPYCYGNGCFVCGMTGHVETAEWREAREEHEDGAYDRWKDERMEDDR